MAKIALEFKNYKKIKDLNFDLNDYDAVIVNGKNREGKTSLINGIFENLTATNLSNQPLTIGEEKGEKTVIVEDKNGKEIKIVHTFSKKSPKGTFYAIQDGQKISSVTKIRELIGDANAYTINEFFMMCKSIPGRRKFIQEVLMRLMTSEQIAKINVINNQINSKDGEFYITRTTLNSELKALEAIPGLTDEQKTLLSKKDELLENKATSEKSIKATEHKIDILEKILNNIISIENGSGWQTLTKDDIIFKHEKAKTLFSNLIDLEFQALQYKPVCEKGLNSLDIVLTSDQNNLLTITNELAEIEKIEYSQSANGNLEEKIKDKKKEIEDINKKINNAIDLKSKILSESNLPKGLIIHSESEFTYNGFDFNENEISESEAWLLLAELTIPIYDCKYFRMGNAAIYGKDALEALTTMAAKYGKILALEKVNDDVDDIYVEGIVWDENYADDNLKELVKENNQQPEAIPQTISENETVGDKLLKDAAKRRIENGNETAGDKAIVNSERAKNFIEDAKKRGVEGLDDISDDPLQPVSFDKEKDAYNKGEQIPESKKAEDITDENIKKLDDLF